MTPRAHIVHQTRNRVRLRIREKRQDQEYFEEVKGRLASLKGVGEVRVNSNTGSVVLLHPGKPFEEIAPGLQQPDLFVLFAGPEPEFSALTKLQTGIAKVNQIVSQGTAGVADLKTVAVIVLVALAIRQIRRGSLIGPALPLLWSALDIALRFKKEQQAAETETEANPEPDTASLPMS
jgi:hypothetical protein